MFLTFTDAGYIYVCVCVCMCVFVCVFAEKEASAACRKSSPRGDFLSPLHPCQIRPV
jgi:hypothetical protein